MKTKSRAHAAGDRRKFLKQMGGGVALGGLGAGLFPSAGLGGVLLASDGEQLDFGKLGRLVDLLTATPLDGLQPALVSEIKAGVSLESLIAAGALANAQAFGGQDYNGYHAFMALIPALEIARSSVGTHAPLPVLKVLYRNSKFIHDVGAHRRPRLKQHADASKNKPRSERGDESEALVAHVRRSDMRRAEGLLDDLVQRDPGLAFEALLPVIWQEVDVHRVVLAWRAWDMQRITGEDQARTLLRQSIRQCVDRESDDGDNRRARREMPMVLGEDDLLSKPLGKRALDVREVMQLAEGISRGARVEGARLVAQALVGGVDPRSVGEALSLSATYLMLRQQGRTSATKGRAVGSVHGAGTGVHASDTAAAWRGMASFGSERQCKLALVAGGYHAAGQSDSVASDFFDYSAEAEEVRVKSADALLRRMNVSIRDQDQAGASAAASAYAQTGSDMQPLLDDCREHSVRAEGALHAEKYFRTQAEVIGADRSAFRPLHAAALARVCASQAGEAAAGREQALELLG